MGAGQISIKYGFKGPNHAVSTACATGAHAIGDAYNFIKYGTADVMVAGASEACINPLAMAGFCRLRALSTALNNDPKKASMPFDRKRNGFVMGEGAGVLVLEEMNHALKRNVEILGEVLGYGLTGDASHLTAPRSDGLGAILVMKNTLSDSGVQPSEIEYINAHATSTPVGDIIEAKAIMSVFSENLKTLKVSSTKGAIGHLLGAAGSVEAAFTVLAIKNGLVPPTINFNSSDDEVADINFVPNCAQIWKSEKRIALTNSFGFGGTNASLCIRNFDYNNI